MNAAAALPGASYRTAAASDRPVWALDGRDWPLRQHSSFVEAAGMRWHVQRYGAGPDILLLHGTAASSHSWRDLGPRLATRFRVCAVDLPGHGFSSAPPDPSFYRQRPMAQALAELLDQLDVRPAAIIGHSAGAALGAALVLEAGSRPQTLISLNGALDARHAFSSGGFSALARLASAPPLAQLFAWRATTEHVDQVIQSTGSHIDARGLELYRRLFARRGHVSAAFRLMAEWNSGSVLDRLVDLPCRLILFVADDDKAVPPSSAARIAADLDQADLIRIPEGGHLAHEATPEAVADVVLKALGASVVKEIAP